MKRERVLQVFVGLLGLVYLSLIYPLYTDLWHSKWLLENEQRMRADVSELVYRARAVSIVGRQKARHLSGRAGGFWGHSTTGNLTGVYLGETSSIFRMIRSAQ